MSSPAWTAGDILAFYGTDALSWTIRAATSFPVDPWSVWNAPSHVAIVATPRNPILNGLDAPLLVESTKLCPAPCLAKGEKTRGVQVHPIEDRIRDYTRKGGRVDVYRLVGLHELTDLEEQRLEELVEWIIEQASDYDEIGAALSASRLARVFRLLNADTSRLFCSELIAALLMRLGVMNRANPMTYSPGRLLKELRRTGVYTFVRHYTGGPGGDLRLHLSKGVQLGVVRA